MTGDQLEHLDEARKSIQDLAPRFRAFAMNEDWPVRFIRWRGYDPTKASTGLFGFSNRIDIAGSEKAAHRKAIEELLRIPRHLSCGAWTTLTALPTCPTATAAEKQHADKVIEKAVQWYARLLLRRMRPQLS